MALSTQFTFADNFISPLRSNKVVAFQSHLHIALLKLLNLANSTNIDDRMKLPWHPQGASKQLVAVNKLSSITW